MEEIVEVVVEAGLEVVEVVGAAADSKSKGGCIFFSIILLVIIGVGAYFVLK